MWFGFFKLQLKRSVKITLKSLGVFALMGMIAAAFLWLISVLLLHSGVMPKLQIGISIPESESMSRLAARYISSTDGFQSLCEFVYEDDEAALNHLREGKLQAVIVLPENFFHDVDIGLNPPVRLYMTEKQNLETALFSHLVESGTAYLRIAESGVYTALGADRAFTLIEEEGLGDAIAVAYAKEILGRDRVFAEGTLSPFGDYSAAQYYIGAGYLMLLVLFSVSFSFLYDKKNDALEEKLYICGLRGSRLQALKVAAETIILFVLGFVLYLILLVTAALQKSYFTFFSITFIWKLFFVCLGIAVITDWLFSLFRSGHAVLIILLTAAFCGGIFLPISFLPVVLQKISVFLPFSYWFRFLADGLFKSGIFGLFYVVIWIVIGWLLGAVSVWKK